MKTNSIHDALAATLCIRLKQLDLPSPGASHKDAVRIGTQQVDAVLLADEVTQRLIAWREIDSDASGIGAARLNIGFSSAWEDAVRRSGIRPELVRWEDNGQTGGARAYLFGYLDAAQAAADRVEAPPAAPGTPAAVLTLAREALEHSAPKASHYPEPVARHSTALAAVTAALAPETEEQRNASWRDFLGGLCARIESRATAQGWKGKTRDRYAVEMVGGALASLETLGDDRAGPFGIWALLVVGTGGFSEVAKTAQEWRERGNILPGSR